MAEEQQKCIFCQIIDGNVPARKVYEDENVVAILDIYPARAGHVLLLTRKHFAIMPQIPDNVIGHLGKITKKLSKALIHALKAGGTTTFIANGVAGGQRAQHFMMHIIPRMSEDNLPFDIPKGQISEEEKENVIQIIAPVIKNLLGYSIQIRKSRLEEESNGESNETAENNGETEQEEDSSSMSLDELSDFLSK